MLYRFAASAKFRDSGLYASAANVGGHWSFAVGHLDLFISPIMYVKKAGTFENDGYNRREKGQNGLNIRIRG